MAAVHKGSRHHFAALPEFSRLGRRKIGGQRLLHAIDGFPQRADADFGFEGLVRDALDVLGGHKMYGMQSRAHGQDIPRAN